MRWGRRIPAPASGTTTGVYAVSWADDADASEDSRQPCPLSERALASLLDARPEYVHYTYCDRVNEVEQKMLTAFACGVTEKAREALVDSERVMPFANFEYPPGNRKRHGIAGATAPRSRSVQV